jgi:3-isopropylmalate dehydrogenase/3-isopropylmalate/(R)-2-methylmalate dehydratase small subunit
MADLACGMEEKETMELEGRAWKVGDHVDTDAILPAKYLNISDESVLARHCFEDLLPRFAGEVRSGDILVAGQNFGCGSSREHAPMALKGAGISVVLASSFARIFYRNAFNIGLPVLESPEAAAGTREGDRIVVDLTGGRITNLRTQEVYPFQPLPPFMADLISAGGLMPLLRSGGWREGVGAP